MLTYSELRQSLKASLLDFLPPEEAQAEANRWFSEGLGLEPSWFYAHGMEPVEEAHRHQIGVWLERRLKGEPWAYILGWTLWRSRRFECGPATLIPRPETELVLEAALEVGRHLGVLHAVDVGTGTGILGITLALETDWAITATDLSPKALEVARRNASSLGATLGFRCRIPWGWWCPTRLMWTLRIAPPSSGSCPSSRSRRSLPRTGDWPWRRNCSARLGSAPPLGVSWRSAPDRGRS